MQQEFESIFPKIENYNEEEYQELIIKYNSIPARKNFIQNTLNIDLLERDYKILHTQNKVTLTLMGFMLNYLQTIDKLKGDFGHDIFFHVYESFQIGYFNMKLNSVTDFEKKRLVAQYKKEQLIYLILLLHKKQESWVVFFLKIPTLTGFAVYTNNLKFNQLDEDFAIMGPTLKEVYDIDINNFGVNSISVNLQGDCDGGVFLVNFIYKFVCGQELEKIKFQDIDANKYKQILEWVLLKLKFAEEENSKKDLETQKKKLKINFLDYYEDNQKKNWYSHLDARADRFEPKNQEEEFKIYFANMEKYRRNKIDLKANKNQQDKGMNTFYSIDTNANFDFGTFGNKFISQNKEMSDACIQTFPQGLNPYVSQDVEQIKKEDRPYYDYYKLYIGNLKEASDYLTYEELSAQLQNPNKIKNLSYLRRIIRHCLNIESELIEEQKARDQLLARQVEKQTEDASKNNQISTGTISNKSKI